MEFKVGDIIKVENEEEYESLMKLLYSIGYKWNGINHLKYHDGYDGGTLDYIFIDPDYIITYSTEDNDTKHTITYKELIIKQNFQDDLEKVRDFINKY